jgi:hypothetical protein
MTGSDKKTSAKASKKEARQEIISKLETAMGYLKPVIGEKKFAHRVKKASKLFMADAAKPAKDKAEKKKVKKHVIPVSPKAKKKAALAVGKAAPAKKAAAKKPSGKK